MTVLLRDDFTDAFGTQLDVHTPAPIDPGAPSIWEYVVGGAAPYEIQSNAVIDGGTGVANPARLSTAILDDLVEIFASFTRGGPQTLAQTGQLHLCMFEGAINAQPGRIQVLIGNVNVEITLYDDAGFATRLSGPFAHGRNVTVPFELGMTKIGTAVVSYTQDIGGANRVNAATMILTGPEQAFYENGAHRMTGISCTGTQAGHYICDFVQVEDSVAAPINVNLNPVGSTLGTIASGIPVIDFNVVSTPVGSTLGRIVTGLPTFAGTFQEARPSAPAASDTLTLAAPPQKYNQYDESQTRRQLELSATLENLRMDAIERVLAAQVVTEGVITQTNASDLIVLPLGVPVALDFPTDLATNVPNRWSEPTEGTLRYTSVDFSRLGLAFVFFQVSPAANNQTFRVDVLVNEVIVRTVEFQTGNSGLLYPVSISDLTALGVGTTDIRVQLTNVNAAQNATVSQFAITAADFFSAIGFDLAAPATTSVTAAVPVDANSFLRELVRHFATLLPASTPVLVSQNRHRISGDVGLGNLAVGYAQQRSTGPSTIVIPAINTFVALDPPTTLNIGSSAWLQPANAELSVITDTKRIATINIVLVLDTNAANQMFQIRGLLNGTPVGNPYEILLQGNQAQEHALGFLLELPVGLTTISFEVQNTSTGQDLDVDGFAIAITDQLADG